MIRSSIIENAYFSSSHDGDIEKVLKEIKSVEIDPSKLMADIYPSDNKK